MGRERGVGRERSVSGARERDVNGAKEGCEVGGREECKWSERLGEGVWGEREG